MFDFERLEVYSRSREFLKIAMTFIYGQKDADPQLIDKLKQSVTGILINLAEGTGRMAETDKMIYYSNSRSCVFETVAILQILLDQKGLDQKTYDLFYADLETISKMLLGMIRSLGR